MLPLTRSSIFYYIFYLVGLVFQPECFSLEVFDDATMHSYDLCKVLFLRAR